MYYQENMTLAESSTKICSYSFNVLPILSRRAWNLDSGRKSYTKTEDCAQKRSVKYAESNKKREENDKVDTWRANMTKHLLQIKRTKCRWAVRLDWARKRGGQCSRRPLTTAAHRTVKRNGSLTGEAFTRKRADWLRVVRCIRFLNVVLFQLWQTLIGFFPLCCKDTMSNYSTYKVHVMHNKNIQSTDRI